MNRIPAVVILLCTLFLPLFGQEPDTSLVVMETDTIYQFGDEITLTDSVELPVELVEERMEKDPMRAIMLALVLPGMGQAYNGKYFKIPIVFAALGGAGYAIAYNTKNYRLALDDYALDESDTNERYLQFWRRNMELSYIAMVAVYGLQVLDAYVDALLFTWDVNDQLSIRVAPALQPMLVPGTAPTCSYGLSCGFKIKSR